MTIEDSKPATHNLPGREAFAAADEAEHLLRMAKSSAYRKANLLRAELRRSGASPEEVSAAFIAELKRQPSVRRFYARGRVPLNNFTQFNDANMWLPFASGPSCYYWLWRFKQSKDNLREALHIDVRWTAATRHRIDVANPRHVSWVFDELKGYEGREKPARWHLVRSIASIIAYEPPQDWREEVTVFTKVMAHIRDYNRRVLSDENNNFPEIGVARLCHLIEESL